MMGIEILLDRRYESTIAARVPKRLIARKARTAWF
jgi:hypothetical protein